MPDETADQEPATPSRPMFTIAEAVAGVGFVLTVVGVAMIYLPAAFIFAGLTLTGGGILLAKARA